VEALGPFRGTGSAALSSAASRGCAVDTCALGNAACSATLAVQAVVAGTCAHPAACASQRRRYKLQRAIGCESPCELRAARHMHGATWLGGGAASLCVRMHWHGPSVRASGGARPLLLRCAGARVGFMRIPVQSRALRSTLPFRTTLLLLSDEGGHIYSNLKQVPVEYLHW
jgi:hypothetical protein